MLDDWSEGFVMLEEVFDGLVLSYAKYTQDLFVLVGGN
jgi:hypothetical protein